MVAGMEYSEQKSNHSHTIASGSTDVKVVQSGVIIEAVDDLCYAIETLEDAFGKLVSKLLPSLHDSYPQMTENKEPENDNASALYKDITMNANKIYRLRDFINEIRERVEL